MDLQIYNNINLSLVKASADVIIRGIIKGYKAGVLGVIKRNKEFMLKFNEPDDGSNYLTASRSFFKADYSAIDLKTIQNFKIEAFEVAFVGHYEAQERLKALALEVWEQHGQDFKAFETRAREIMAQYVPKNNKAVRRSWLETNLNTGIGSAYHGAQYIRLQDKQAQELYPAWQYMTRNDSHVRPEHERLDGKIFLRDNPIWREIFPPNGWNCRCYVIPLMADEIAGKPLTGELMTAQEREDAVQEIDKNFRRNPGETESIWRKWLDSKYKDFDMLDKKRQVQEYAKQIYGTETSKTQIKSPAKAVLDKRIEEHISDIGLTYGLSKVMPGNATEYMRKYVADDVWEALESSGLKGLTYKNGTGSCHYQGIINMAKTWGNSATPDNVMAQVFVHEAGHAILEKSFTGLRWMGLKEQGYKQIIKTADRPELNKFVEHYDSLQEELLKATKNPDFKKIYHKLTVRRNGLERSLNPIHSLYDEFKDDKNNSPTSYENTHIVKIESSVCDMLKASLGNGWGSGHPDKYFNNGWDYRLHETIAQSHQLYWDSIKYGLKVPSLEKYAPGAMDKIGKFWDNYYKKNIYKNKFKIKD